MPLLALGLLLLAAVAHASWNLLLRRAQVREAFGWWLLAAVALPGLPIAAAVLARDPLPPGVWGLVVVRVLLEAAYVALLARAYTHADLSLTYPIVRGLGAGIAPILGVALLGERVGWLGVLGVGAVVAGIGAASWWGAPVSLLHLRARALRSPGVHAAALAGLAVAAYATLDKVVVGHVPPLLYMYLLTTGAALALLPYVLLRHGSAPLRAELVRQPLSILVAGGLNFAAYSLVLTALTLSQVSYVAPAREVSIVVAVLMGMLLLNEPVGRGRLLGALTIALGVALLTLAQ